MTKHLRLAVAAFSATALLLAGCADDADDTTVDTVDIEETDTDDDAFEDESDDEVLEDESDEDEG
jgi:hypothetical protein